MDYTTLRARVARLIQKSRRALRLYSSVSKDSVISGRDVRGQSNSSPAHRTPFGDLQVLEWKGVNAELLKQLSLTMEHASTKAIARDVINLRDRFHGEWRNLEAEIHTKQRELIFASENGDFIRSANLSSELVVMKARAQASQAAHHELSSVVRIDAANVQRPPVTHSEPPPIELKRSNEIADAAEAIRLSDNAMIDEDHFAQEQAVGGRKVIPLRRYSTI